MRLKNLSFIKSGEILIAVVAFPFANCSINASRADDNSLDCGPSANDNLSPISLQTAPQWVGEGERGDAGRSSGFPKVTIATTGISGCSDGTTYI
jgi:hypothetical protein